MKQDWPVCELGAVLQIQQVLLSKFAFGPETFKGPFEKRAQRL